MLTFWYYAEAAVRRCLQNRCSENFAKFHRKSPVLKSLFKKVAKSDSTSATNNKQISQRVTSVFLQRATSATSNERIFHRITSDFLQRVTSATSNERNLQRVTSNFATSNEWKVTPHIKWRTVELVKIYIVTFNVTIFIRLKKCGFYK